VFFEWFLGGVGWVGLGFLLGVLGEGVWVLGGGFGGGRVGGLGFCFLCWWFGKKKKKKKKKNKKKNQMAGSVFFFLFFFGGVVGGLF